MEACSNRYSIKPGLGSWTDCYQRPDRGDAGQTQGGVGGTSKPSYCLGSPKPQTTNRPKVCVASQNKGNSLPHQPKLDGSLIGCVNSAAIKTYLT